MSGASRLTECWKSSSISGGAPYCNMFSLSCSRKSSLKQGVFMWSRSNGNSFSARVRESFGGKGWHIVPLSSTSAQQSCRGPVATTIVTQHTHIRVLAGHVPHHATIPQTEALLHPWGETLQGRVVVLGMDANETFRPPLADKPGCYACTGRGEVILEWLLSRDLKLPPQDLLTPTYHPYNTTMRPRRLDYIATRGGPQDLAGWLHARTGRFRP